MKDNRGRRWSWAALIAAAAIWGLTLPTWGLSILLAPIGLALTLVAWWRSRHEPIFWVGAGLNAANTLSLIGFAIGILTGDIGIGLE